jgi:adenylate kinase family enzyme
MKKVLIIGSSGAGKSTFARRLGAITGLEVIHLDVLHWKPDWTEPDKSEWQKTVENALKGDAWIIDGNFGGTMEMRIRAADTVIFLDLPRALCVYRIVKRVVTYRKGTRPDMAEGCDEKFDWEFLKWVWNYPERSRPKVEALLKSVENEKKVIRLKSKREVENFFVNLESDAVKSS